MNSRVAILALSLLPGVGPASAEPVAVAAHGMVVSEEAKASRIGADILRRGGNAVDAAVATGFALAVTWPEAGNIGGGGFMVIHLAASKRAVAIDYRETAPASATRTMFLDATGTADPQKSRASGLAVGVPGTVAGLAYAHARFGSGRFTLAQLIAPAVALARDGFEVDERLAASLARGQLSLVRWQASREIFLKPDGVALATGDRLVQRDLANTLEIVAREGPQAFYTGLTAEQISLSVRAAGGGMTRHDLANYLVRERVPARGSYRGHEVVSMPPPSSGGVHLVQMLNVLEGFDLRGLGDGTPETLHLLIETMKLAYADRAEHLGDPDFAQVPVKGLTSKAYAAKQRASIERGRARPAAEIKPGQPQLQEQENTTHFSVVDRDGNAVSNTYTLNFNFGVGLVADSTGVLLNNELDDFAAAPGQPNAFGLVGGEANAPAPRKRPLSSMTPAIVLRDGRAVLVTGAAGGSRIINAVLQTIVNAVDFGKEPAAAVAAPRVHHQWLPDEVNVEAGVPEDTRQALQARGHRMVERRVAASANSIFAGESGWIGVVDPRSGGAAAAP